MNMSSPQRLLRSTQERAEPPTRGADGSSRTRGDRARLVRRTLAAADLLGLFSAFLVAILAFGSRETSTNEFGVPAELGVFAATLPGWLLLARLHGLYDRDERHAGHSTVDEVIPVATLVTVGSWLLYAVAALTRFADPYPPKLVTFWALAIVLVVAGRVGGRAFCRRRPGYVQNLIVVGAGEIGLLVARKLEDHPEHGVRLLGFVEEDAEALAETGLLLGSLEQLPQIVREQGVERVLIAFPSVSLETTTNLVRRLRELEVHVDIVPRFVELVTPGATIHAVEGLPLISLSPVRPDRLSLMLKRGIDVIGALLGLLVLAPAFAWIALRIKLDSRGPVLYRHDRVGLRGRPFRLLKFRTMEGAQAGTAGDEDAAAAELRRLLEDPALRAEFERSHKLASDPRVTRFGWFLRRQSLDELPQLVNVLRGDMSLVGPRPVTVHELSRYGADAETLLSFRPGITGYWQVNGRSRTSYEDRVRLDIAYVSGWSLKLDFLILGRTAWVLLTGHGAY
jgi:exopolysaccharide biosynthesis polyprenyl glycosylphosphotransferase